MTYDRLGPLRCQSLELRLDLFERIPGLSFDPLILLNLSLKLSKLLFFAPLPSLGSLLISLIHDTGSGTHITEFHQIGSRIHRLDIRELVREFTFLLFRTLETFCHFIKLTLSVSLHESTIRDGLTLAADKVALHF